VGKESNFLSQARENPISRAAALYLGLHPRSRAPLIKAATCGACRNVNLHPPSPGCVTILIWPNLIMVYLLGVVVVAALRARPLGAEFIPERGVV